MHSQDRDSNRVSQLPSCTYMVCVVVVQEGPRHACGVDACTCGRVWKIKTPLYMSPHRMMNVCCLKGECDGAERQREGTRFNGHMTLKQQTTAERHRGAWQMRDNSGSRTAGVEAELSGFFSELTAAAERQGGAGIVHGETVLAGN